MTRWHLGALLVVFSAALAWAQAPATGSAPSAAPMGWRGDGSGRFPQARPPLEWGRVATTVLALRGQAAAPAEGQTGSPIPDGVIRQWLVATPLTVAEDFKPDKDGVLVEGEADLVGREGQDAGGATWKLVAAETPTLDFRALIGADRVGPDKPRAGALACTHVYSPQAATVSMNLMVGGTGLKLYLNGKAVPVGIHRTTVTLRAGWNRLLVRLVSNATKESPSYYIRTAFFGAADAEFESRNLRWTALMPSLGVGSPVLAGENVLVTSDMCNLLCLDKRTGRIRWIRSATYFDTMTDEERKAHPEIVAEMAPLSARLKEIDAAVGQAGAVEARLAAEKAGLEKKIHDRMRQVDNQKYRLSAPSEAGWAVMTPVTDGRSVWVLYATGVVGCYDLDGTVRWLALHNLPAAEHGHATSPVLVGATLLTGHDVVRAMDAATGRTLWEQPLVWEKSSHNYCRFNGTMLAMRMGSQDVVVTPHGQVLRVADGRQLYFQMFKYGGSGQTPSPVAVGQTLYHVTNNGALLKATLPDAPADSVNLDPTQAADVTTRKFPIFYSWLYNASPLAHEGLVYCVGADGVLTVVDAATMEVVYQKLLDVCTRASHNGGPARGGMGASPALGGEHIYLFGNQGTCVVIEPGRQFKPVARNRIERTVQPGHWGEHQEVTVSCPVFEGDCIYLRAEAALYCIGQ